MGKSNLDKSINRLIDLGNKIEESGGKAVDVLGKLRSAIADINQEMKTLKLDKIPFEKITKDAEASRKAYEKFGNYTKATANALVEAGKIPKDVFHVKEVEEVIKAYTKLNLKLEDYAKKAGETDKINIAVAFSEALKGTKKLYEEKPKDGSLFNEKTVKKMNESLKSTVDYLQKINDALSENKGGLKVQINNKNFTKILDELGTSIDNYHRRHKKSNYFSKMLGLDQEGQRETEKEVKKASEQTVGKLGSIVDKDLSKKIYDKIKTAIAAGVKDGISAGMSAGFKEQSLSKALSAITESLNLKPRQRMEVAQDLISIISGKENTTAIKIAKNNANAKARSDKYKADAAANADIEKTRITTDAETNRIMNVAPDEFRDVVASKAEKEKEIANFWRRRREREDEKFRNNEDQKRKQRERWEKDEIRFREMLKEYDGHELSALEKTKLKLAEKTEEYKRLYQQAYNNKGNPDAHLRVLRQIQEVRRDIALEMYKESKGYDALVTKSRKVHENLSKLSSFFQRMSAFVGSFNSIFSTIRSQAQNLFRYFTNSFRSITSTLRTQLTSAINAGVEQFKNLESAQIGFESFFGQENAPAVMERVRSEALKAPLVTAGDLADYVRQLAPVSNGDANLAINSAMGALKTILYSGSDASEMEYIVKNIRDVIAKGTATAIDIRQFNRAVPGLENALIKAGLQENWLDSEGKLNINRSNAKQVLEMFANLNTAEDSPVKDIFNKMLNTLEGLQDVFVERKAHTMEAILKDSGVFDLIKKVLTDLNDDGVWENVRKFFTNILKNIVDWVKTVDWKAIGDNLYIGFTRIKEAFSTAKDAISGTARQLFGSVTIKDVFDTIWDIVEGVIKGLTTGIQETMKFVKFLKNAIGEDAIRTLATAVGLLVSPFGKVISVLLGMFRDGLSAISRLIATADSVSQAMYKRKIANINKVAGEYADIVTKTDLSGQQILDADYQMYGRGKNATLIARNDETFIRNGKVNYLTNRKNELTKYKDLKFREKVDNVGLGTAVRTTVQPIFTKVGQVAGKAFATAGTFMIGKAITDVVSTVVGGINPAMKDITNTLGTAASAAFAVGKQFGPLAGAAAALVSVFFSLTKEAEKLQQTQEQLRQTTIESSLSQARRDMINNVLDNLQEAGLYDPYEEHSEGAYKAVVEAAAGMTDDMMRDPAEAQRRLLDVYLKERGRTATGEQIDSWIGQGLTGSTAIGEKDLNTLKSVAEGLAAIGQITLSEETVKELGNNYKSWQAYLKNQGFGFNTSETLNNFNGTLEQLTATYDEWKNKELDIKLFYEDEEGNKQSFGSITDDEAIAKWMANNGFVLKDGVWTTQAVIDMNIKTPKTMTQSITDASRDKSNSGAERFALGILDAANRMVGRGNPLLPWAEGGWFNWNLWAGKTAGGKIKPIYRASGGDFPSRGVDTVPIMAQPGEFVMRRSSVSKVGMSTMEALNRGDIARASKLLSSKVNNSWNNSRNWSNVVNNNQRSSRNQINIFNRNMSQRNSSYLGLANRISLA